LHPCRAPYVHDETKVMFYFKERPKAMLKNVKLKFDDF
jgi:hypothetical protein